MMYRVILLLLLPSSVYAQNFNGAPYHAMGNTGVAMESIYSLTNNTAGIARINTVNAAIAYQPHFLSSELRSQAAYLVMPIRNIGTIGFSANNYGISGTSSFLNIRGVYARNFGDMILSSISANYHRYYIQDYQSENRFSADLGFMLILNESINIGAYFRNISFSKFDDDIEQYLPREAGVGVSYKVSKQVTINTDAIYDWYEAMNYRLGFAYSIDDIIIARAGVSSGPTQYYAGFGLKFKAFQVDFSSSFHHRLGTSPQVALAYVF